MPQTIDSQPLPKPQGDSQLSWFGWWLPAMLFLICVLPYSFTYFKHHPDEQHYTDAALEMLRTGDYLTPRTQHGELRFKKPILTYWIIVASYYVFGVSPLSSRLPFVLIGAATIGLTYHLGRKVLQSREGAWLSALIVAFHPALVLTSSQSIPDVMLAFTLLMSVLGFCDLFMDRQRPFTSLLLAYGGIGLAILTKGIPGLAFGVIAVAVSIWFGEWSDRKRRVQHVLVLLPTVLITGAWFVVSAMQHGDAMMNEFVRDQVIDRDGPAWWSPLVQIPLVFSLAIASFLPWSSWLMTVRHESWRNAIEQIRQNRGLQFLSIWSVVFLLLASCVRIINLRYQVVVTPLIAILLASQLLALHPTLFEIGLRRQARLMTGVLASSLGICLVFVPAWSGFSWSLTAFLVMAAAWSILAWHAIPKANWPTAGLFAAVSTVLLLPCGYFGLGSVLLPTFDDRIYSELQAAKLEHKTLWVVAKPGDSIPSRLRVVSHGTMPVKFLRERDLPTFQSDRFRDASVMLFTTPTLPPEIVAEFVVTKIPHGLNVKAPALWEALIHGDLREYLTKCQRSAYLAVRADPPRGLLSETFESTDAVKK